ncbi:Pkinase-domain-containing protein [Xylaria nigripes]|nr:Pkinase-domain-containing protein [Xylaria nigripes]
MDTTVDSQATQQATQNVYDPRRFGQQNSGFSDQDISDIICLLYPQSDATNREVQQIANSPEYARHTTGRYSADAIKSDTYHEDDARNFGPTLGIGDHALVLRLSSPLKDPRLGFTFGRNQSRCDIHFEHDPVKRLSNIHFRIYVNSYGSVLLEDESINGTIVDNKLLQKRGSKISNIRRTLESGSEIRIMMHEREYDLIFRVRIPRREGEYEEAYAKNVDAYLQVAKSIPDDDDPNKTIGPGPSGHVNLFTPTKKIKLKEIAETANGLQRPSSRLPREWRGTDKYARVGVIGKGAFATVHKVTSKYSGRPYAAKELDKRKFMKNGVLDQKVENEMKIMQKVQHPNIVKYIEHFDWDAHQFIIIMEFVPGGDLGKYIQDNHAIAEPHVKIIAEQLVNALGYLHENRITHRDVKPDNILIHSTSPLVVKLTDFGLSKMIDTEQTFLKTFCGTLLYCAPEVYAEYSSYDDYGRRTNRKGHRTVDRERYDHAVDIWSLGGVLFYTLTGSPPFPVSNGITYTELLDRIIKTPLDTSPLSKFRVSVNGINFLSRMIHVRPETRATTTELKSHAWLADVSSRTDKDFDDDLGHSASQLSLDDRQAAQDITAGMSQLHEPDLDSFMDAESGKENDIFAQPRRPRLFGEISSIDNSDAILEDRLNLPLSDTSFGENEPENFSTPRKKASLDEQGPSAVYNASQEDNSRSALLGIGSQSLGGASSIFGDLNMKSRANTVSRITPSEINSLATSKRKPTYDTSDEYDSKTVQVKPSMKRLKSRKSVDDLMSDDVLIASIPKMVKSDTGRQIDYPLPKTIYWDSRNENTWHLNYPEMTHLQYNAFETAAKQRNEEFGPDTTPLWRLAMKYFPPSLGQKKEENSSGKSSDRNTPSTAPSDTFDSQLESQLNISAFDNDLPSALSMSHQSRTEIGKFESTPDSVVKGISIPLRDPILSWGRERNNTVIYEDVNEIRVPKNAFRVVLWREGYTASVGEFRPWEPARVSTSRTMLRASPGPDSYAFYIATKATNGIHVNMNLLQPHMSKATTVTSYSKYWMKLYHGDHITFWGGEDPPIRATLTFECTWGGSSATRPADEPPKCVPAPLAQKLDRHWRKALKSLQHIPIKEKAQIDQEVRMRNMLREQERGRIFELRRLEAIHRLEQRRFRETSPDDFERARTKSPVRLSVPPGRAQNVR